MVIKALGIEHEVHHINLLKGEQRTEEYAKVNPRQKVPAIVDGDLAMGESAAISAYLCNKYPDNFPSSLLYPKEPEKRAKVDQMLCITDAFVQDIMQYPAPPKIFQQGKAPDESKRPVLEKGFEMIEGFLQKTEFIAGDHVTIADFLFYVWVTLPGLVPDINIDYTVYPKMDAWMANMRSLPYHDECNTKGMAELAAIFKNGLTPPPIEFYHFFISPYSRAVHMTLEALEVPYDLKVVNLMKKEQHNPDFLKINPRGKIPAIKIGGFCLSESCAIATFLMNQYASDKNQHMYPKDPKERSKVDKILYLMQDVFDAMIKWLPRDYIFGDGMPVDEDISGVDKIMSELEAGVEGKYLTGDNMTIADLFLYVFCDFANYGNYDWSPYPKLSSVFDAVKALPYHDKVNEACFAQLKGMVKDKMPKLKTKRKQSTEF